MADTKKQMAALKELAEKMGFSLTKKTAPKKMMGGGAAKQASKKMGVSPRKAMGMMRGGKVKKMMRGGKAKK